jgi:hypothetical protein
MELTYEKLIEMLNKIGGAHYNVRTSDAGVLESLNYGEIEYPMVFFVCDTVEFTPNETRYNMIMLVGDVVDDRLLQQTVKQSNMLEITKDIISHLINGNHDYEWIIDEASMTLQPFVDNLPDLLAGWQTNFTIKTPFDNGGCSLPFDPAKLP